MSTYRLRMSRKATERWQQQEMTGSGVGTQGWGALHRSSRSGPYSPPPTSYPGEQRSPSPGSSPQMKFRVMSSLPSSFNFSASSRKLVLGAVGPTEPCTASQGYLWERPPHPLLPSPPQHSEPAGLVLFTPQCPLAWGPPGTPQKGPRPAPLPRSSNRSSSSHFTKIKMFEGHGLTEIPGAYEALQRRGGPKTQRRT